MSNYSEFKLKITPKPGPIQIQMIWQAFKEQMWANAVPFFLADEAVVKWAWDEHEDQFKVVSKLFPDFLFSLEVHPEESWGVEYMKYFKAGKMKSIKRPPFPKYEPRKS